MTRNPIHWHLRFIPSLLPVQWTVLTMQTMSRLFFHPRPIYKKLLLSSSSSFFSIPPSLPLYFRPTDRPDSYIFLLPTDKKRGREKNISPPEKELGGGGPGGGPTDNFNLVQCGGINCPAIQYLPCARRRCLAG